MHVVPMMEMPMIGVPTPLQWFGFWVVATAQGWLLGLMVRQLWLDYKFWRMVREMARTSRRLKAAVDWPE